MIRFKAHFDTGFFTRYLKRRFKLSKNDKVDFKFSETGLDMFVNITEEERKELCLTLKK